MQFTPAVTQPKLLLAGESIPVIVHPRNYQPFVHEKTCILRALYLQSTFLPAALSCLY